MFTEDQSKALAGMYNSIRHDFTYIDNPNAVDELKNHWEPDSELKPAELKAVGFKGICESFARVAMSRCSDAGYKARLVVCYDEVKEGHCICEVADAMEQEAYYFDNRQTHLAVLNDLKGYTFLGVSPWNPVPGDHRPWQLVG